MYKLHYKQFETSEQNKYLFYLKQQKKIMRFFVRFFLTINFDTATMLKIDSLKEITVKKLFD